MADTNTRHQKAECQIVIFPWRDPINSTSNNFVSVSKDRFSLDNLIDTVTEPLSNAQSSESKTIDVSRYVSSASFSKNKSGPSGTFEFSLINDRDWKDVIKPGTWCIIYLSNEGGLKLSNQDSVSPNDLLGQRDKVRCIGYIERVAAQGNVDDETGAVDVEYTLSGRDFGVIYEETELYLNRLRYETTLINSAFGLLRANPRLKLNELLTIIHDLYFNPGVYGKINNSNDQDLSALLSQWLLPFDMAKALGVQFKRNSPYFGNIQGLLDFTESPATKPFNNPIDLLNGVVWQSLKALSMEAFHELFTETDNGKPRLVYRPIPWVLEEKNLGTLKGKIGKFKDLERITITKNDIYDFNIGEDNHTRYNHFFAYHSGTTMTNEVQSQLLSSEFPKFDRESINRHGLRLMHTQFNALIQQGKEKYNPELVRDYNELLKHYWENAHKFESGSISIEGNGKVKLGKVLSLASPDIKYLNEKLFYIEGYEDNFEVGSNGETSWTQNIIVTRGTPILGVAGRRQSDYKDQGDFTRSK